MFDKLLRTISEVRPSDGRSSPISIAQLFFEEPSQIMRIAGDGHEMIDRMVETESRRAAPEPALILDAGAVAAAVLNSVGDLVAQTDEFLFDKLDTRLSRELAVRALRQGSVVIDPCEPVIYAPSATLEMWDWPKSIAHAVDNEPGVVVFSPRLQRKGVIQQACAAFGLRATQTLVLEEIIRKGSIKAAASELGISHQRARALVAEALASTNSASVQGIVTKISMSAFGVVAEACVSSKQVLADIWGLTQRQADLALLVAEGHSRNSAGRFLGLSEASVKKEMAAIYQILGVSSAADLAVRMSTVRLQSMLSATDRIRGDLIYLGAEPLQFAFDNAGRRIAYSDYGPPTGFPLFYIHSSMTSRPVPRVLRRALAGHGFRVISIDRPGFGLTSKASGNHFEQAARDFCVIQEKLQATPALAVARGGAQFLIELATHRPNALCGALIINPDPAAQASAKREGPLGAAKGYFQRSPFMISALAGLAARLLSPERLATWMQRAVVASPADCAAARNPETVEDYWCSVKSFASGALDGYVTEQIWLATVEDRQLMTGSWPWHFLIGAQDMLHDSETTAAHWAALLPGSQIEIIENGGRLLAFTHAEMIADILSSMRHH